MELDPSLITLFNEAIEHDDAVARAQFLAEVCGADPLRHGRVRALLDAHEAAGGFFSDPSRTPGGAGVVSAGEGPLSEKPGDTLGRYKLLEQIGEGGCGVVYMAEQRQPVYRKVALKVIKLGMDTKQVMARFEAERQALALMDHPNIAKVLDADATEGGRPYFVMELVRGTRITEFCDRNELSLSARLELFTQVCHAIQHAHQKGVIHRDIKPSNILVTLHDGVPVPKVIDFGIAKATTGQRLTDHTLFTAFEQFIGTPAYMSPEQAEMSGLDIDTRSDVYALGVLLYELLTGQPPFDPKELMASGLDAMRRIIREQEPARPSTRLTTLLAADLSTIAKHRQSESVRLTNSLRGDLDWIIMKALEKDRTRRYESASAMARDIQRHQGNEPVHARPPDNFYRFRRLVRRNRTAFAAAGAVAAALLIGAGVSIWQAIRATKAEAQQIALRKEAQENASNALTEASKSKQVARFLEEMLKGVGPSVSRGMDTKLLREILDTTSRRIASELETRPEVRSDLGRTMGTIFLELGDAEKANRIFEETLALRKAQFGSVHEKVAESLLDLSLSQLAQRRYEEAANLGNQGYEMRKKLLGAENPDTVTSLANLGLVFNNAGKFAESEKIYRESLALRRKIMGEKSQPVARLQAGLAVALLNRNEYGEASSMAREAVAIMRTEVGANNSTFTEAIRTLGEALTKQRQFAEAEKVIREGLQMEREMFTDKHPHLLVLSLTQLASVLRRVERFVEAELVVREALSLRRGDPDKPPPDAADPVSLELAWILCGLGKDQEAEPMLREAVAIQKSLEHSNTGYTLRALANCLGRQGKPVEPLALLNEAVSMLKAQPDVDWAEVASCLDNLGAIHADQKPGEAEHCLLEALQICRTQQIGGPTRTGALRNLGAVYQNQNRLKEVEPLLREELTFSVSYFGEESREVAIVKRLLGSLLDRLNRGDEAEVLLRESLSLLGKISGKQDREVAGISNSLGWALDKRGKTAEAEVFYREPLPYARAQLIDGHFEILYNFGNLLNLLLAQGRTADADLVIEDFVGHYQSLKEDSPVRGQLNSDLLELLLRRGKVAEAEPFIVEAKRGIGKMGAKDIQGNMENLRKLVSLLENQGRGLEADTTIDHVLVNLGKPGFESEVPGKVSWDLADLLLIRGRVQEARPFVVNAIRWSKESGSTVTTENLHGMAEVLWRNGLCAEAEPLLRRELEQMLQIHPPESVEALGVSSTLARLLSDWAWSERGLSKDKSRPDSTVVARAREAENLLRANLAIRLAGADPGNSQATVHVPSRLGGALLAVVATDSTLEPSAREAKLCEAEKLLLQSQQVIGELERSPAGKKIADKYQKDGLDRLVRLYQWWGKPKKAESFQRQLNNFGTPQSKPNASGLAERSR